MSAITDPQITVSHRVPLELARWIEVQATKLGIKKSEVVRRALAAARDAETNEQEEAA